MTNNVHVLEPDASLRDAAILMRTRDLGFVPIVDGSGPIGVVTDRDLAVRGIARGDAAATVLDVMTPNVAEILVDQEVSHAMQVMRDRKVRRVLVLDDDRQIAGVIAVSDLIAHEVPAQWIVDTLA